MRARKRREKGYNTRESIRANSLAINLVFSRVCGLFEDKIWQPINVIKSVLSEFQFVEMLVLRNLEVETNYNENSYQKCTTRRISNHRNNHEAGSANAY